jgi:hypothetical protein
MAAAKCGMGEIILQISIYTWVKIPECFCKFAQTTIFCSDQVCEGNWEIEKTLVVSLYTTGC